MSLLTLHKPAVWLQPNENGVFPLTNTSERVRRWSSQTCSALGKDPALELCEGRWCEVPACPLLWIHSFPLFRERQDDSSCQLKLCAWFPPIVSVCLKEARQGGGAAVQTGCSAAPSMPYEHALPLSDMGTGGSPPLALAVEARGRSGERR